METTHILIVEDDPDARETLAELLVDEGYHVASAPDGKAALEWLGRGRPVCLILLDLMMPVMDGWEFRRRQALDPRLASLRYVVMSGANDEAKGEVAQGAVGCFDKPLNVDALLEVVDRYCRPAPAC